MRKFDLGQEGTLLIGMTSSASVHPICISVIEEFRMAQPLVALQIEEGANHDLLRLLEEERLDFAFVRSEVDRYPLVTRTTLAKEPMVVAIPGKHPLAQGAPDPLRLADLAAVDWVIVPAKQRRGHLRHADRGLRGPWVPSAHGGDDRSA